jgi:hypothetical protein
VVAVVNAWNPTEEELLQNVLELARLLGWRCYHTRDSRKSASGFPDVVMVRPPRLIFAELKRLPETNAAGRPRPEQRAWLDDIMDVAEAIEAISLTARGRAPGIEVYVWRPADWLDGSIEEALRAS